MKDKITYSKCGDYYIPDLSVPDTKEYIIGKYGRLRKQFLKEHHKSFYATLMIEGKLSEHLAEIDETCHNVLKDMVSKMAKQEEVTEQLKADNQMLWVKKMNSNQSVNPAFNPDEESAKDTCYRDIPPIDNEMFTIARKLILESKR